MSIIGAIAVPHPPLIVPAVGKGEQRRIQATIEAYERAVRWLLAHKPNCLVITSPHAPLYRDGFHVTCAESIRGDMARFRAPEERILASCDVELAREIIQEAEAAHIPCTERDYSGEGMDHATYVPLHFVVEACDGALPCPIVRVGLSGLSPETHRELGRAIARASENLSRRVAFIASGDLSHKLIAEGPYGFAPEGPLFDERIGEIFESGDLDGLFAFDEAFCDAAAECGLRSFQIMAGALDGLDVETELLSREGPFGVGYGVATCRVRDAGEEGGREACDPHVALARLAVETYVRSGRTAEAPDDIVRALGETRAGVFVSLHERGELRGCIGTISATCPSLAQEIVRNGISACSRDPRFAPVSADELDYLEYSVDVLGPAQLVDSTDELDPARYGVIVTKGARRGLLLPNLEGVDTVADQLAIAKRKAGIDPRDDAVTLERFEVVRYTRGGEPRIAS